MEVKLKIPNLFPYQIKRRDNFYFRDHPVDLNPKSPRYQKYWNTFFKHMVEGKWIYDDGTWVFMAPKLFFYVNYPTIADKNRNIVNPDLRDNEWIIFTYFLCVEGFSGFEDDEKYTCHELVGRFEKDPDSLNHIEINKIPPSAKKENGSYKKYIEPWYYLTNHYLLDEPAEKPLGQALYDNPRYNACILSARGVGKATRLDEKVRVRNGWVKMLDINTGDHIYGGNGKLTRVLATHDHLNLDFYKVELRDGRELDVCGDHLWKVWDKYATSKSGKRGDWVVKDTKTILDTYVNLRVDSKHKSKYGEIKQLPEYRYAIPLSESLKDEEGSQLPIDPYVLGVLLGDGCISQKSITFTTEDQLIAQWVDDNLPNGFYVTKHNSNKYGYNITSESIGFWNLLSELNLFGTKSDTKFIPDKYLYNSEENRLRLLKGLMDANGWSNERGIIEYYTVSDQLADDFINLVRSLGIGCSRGIKKTSYNVHGIKKRGKGCHRIRLTTDKAVFELPRKLNYLNHIKSKAGKSRYDKSYIVNVKKTGSGPGRCITLDNEDHTYVTKDYIRTHNSFTTFVGDFLHEWLTSGIKRYSDRSNANKPALFGMGSAMGPQLQRSINNAKSAYYNMPGSYVFKDEDKQSVQGAFFKKVQGSWVVGNGITHIVKLKKGGSVDLHGSSLQMVALTKDRTTIGAGDRFRRIYIEEFGFLSNAIDVHGSNRDSLQAMGERVGSAIYLGCVCAGSKVWNNKGELVNIETIQQSDGILGYSDEIDEVVKQEITYINPPQSKNCYRITTNTGRFIDCSDDHPIYVRKRWCGGTKSMKKTPDWCRTDNVNLNDGIAVVDHVDVWGNEIMIDPRLIGWLVGDGTYGKGQNIRLSGADDEVWDHVQSNYDVVMTHEAPTKDGRIMRKGRIKGVIPEIEKLGIRGQVSVHKSLPRILFSCDKKTVCEFIGGYFDADGCVSINKKGDYAVIKITSISVQMLEGIQILLNKLGVHGRIVNEGKLTDTKGSNHDVYSLYIKDKYSIINFHDNIVFKIGYKQNKLNHARQIAKSKKDYTLQSIKGLRWERVVDIEYLGMQPVYNLNASDTHTYIVNGIQTHNTGGDMEAIRQPKAMFTNPDGYDIFSIPNYWSGKDKKCGLFLSKIYGLLDYKDTNGNTDIEAAYKFILKEREEEKLVKDSISYDLGIMFNPLVPDEMLRPGNSTILPKQEAQDQLNKMEKYDLFRKKAQVGRLVWNPLSERGVEWKKDLVGNLRPVLETKFDDTLTYTNKEGAVIIYEQPPEYIPEELYWVVYDPAQRSGDGESFHSVLVYKYFYSGSEKTYYDTIVAEWIGRKERLEDNYEEVVRLARYFNARIFPEVNIAGFVDWCIKNNYSNLLEGDAHHLEQEIHGHKAISRTYRQVGFQMQRRKKDWCLRKLRDWLLEVKEVDAISGIPLIRTMDWILSPRILHEVVEYIDDPKENFDHISSLLGLMLLIGKLEGKAPVDIDHEDRDQLDSVLIPQINKDNENYRYAGVHGRCRFLDY